MIERTKELREREAELQAQNMRFAAAISNMSQGLVMFDSQTRLVICNQRFLAMYRLEADGIRPGHTLRHLLERRIANGTISCDAEHYADNVWAKVKLELSTRFIELNDGRTIAIANQPMPAAAGCRPTKTSPSGGRRK